MKSIVKKIAYIYLIISKKMIQTLFPDKNKDKPVIFVAGVQRSGTNMVMDVLERSYETDVYHERDERAFNNYEMREIPVIMDLYQQSKGKYFVIKTLCELQRLNELMDTFPNSKAIWVLRHYDDSINSMLVSFKNQADQARQVAGDRLGSQWRGQGMSDATHQKVRELVHDDISDATGAAIFWYYRNILFFENNFDKNNNIMLISYEKLVRNPQQQFQKIFDFLGLKYTPRISKNVHARSIRLREPKPIDTEVRDLCETLHKQLMQRALK